MSLIKVVWFVLQGKKTLFWTILKFFGNMPWEFFLKNVVKIFGHMPWEFCQRYVAKFFGHMPREFCWRICSQILWTYALRILPGPPSDSSGTTAANWTIKVNFFTCRDRNNAQDGLTGIFTMEPAKTKLARKYFPTPSTVLGGHRLLADEKD